METATERYSGGSKHVLIVDNDDRTLHDLEELVRSEGFSIRTTWSGREALALIESQPFDVVLVDNHLPDIYYGEFLQLARRHARCLVVMQKSKPLPGSLRRYKTMGATAVVDKDDPMHLRQLLAAQARQAGTRLA
jgi:CheY-like chemotaxis protein